MNKTSWPPSSSCSVVGSGSVGSYLAAKLSSVCPVIRISRDVDSLGQTHRSASLKFEGDFQWNGLIPIKPWRELTPPDLGSLIFITTKVPELARALSAVSHLARPGSRIVLCQNGIGVYEEVSRALPMYRFARLVSWVGVKPTSPGHFEVSGDKGVDWAAESETEWDDLGALLSQAGLGGTRAPSIPALEWGKGIVNAVINGICALAGEPNRAIVEKPELRSMADQVFKEAVEVAACQGVLIGEDQRAWIDTVATSTGANLNSSLQDLKAGRRTEIQWLNGAIERLGAQHGIKTPVNSMITKMVEARESKI